MRKLPPTRTPFHKEQEDAYEELDNIIRKSGKRKFRALLEAQPQVGKTGFMIYGSIQRALEAEELGIDCLNLLNLADSNRALKEQLLKQLEHNLWFFYKDDDLLKKYYVEHRPKLRHLEKMLTGKGMLNVWNDEAHLAALLHGIRRRFQDVSLTHDGVSYLQVEVSATLFPHRVRHRMINSPYDATVRLLPGYGYNSLEIMRNNERLKQGEKVIEENEPTRFLHERIESLGNNNQYIVLRTPRLKNFDAQGPIIDAIRSVNKHIHVITADMNQSRHHLSDEQLVISDISERLTKTPEGPTVILIKEALRVGIVLKKLASSNINQMIDTLGINDDTVVQSLAGRSCGYNKIDDTFPIYTKLEAIERAIKYFNGERIDPSSRHSKSSKVENTGRYQIVERDKLTQGEDFKEVVHCSANNKYDVAKHVLRDEYLWTKRLVWLDQPNVNYQRSWDTLLMEKPEFIGKYLTFVLNNEIISDGILKNTFIDSV